MELQNLESMQRNLEKLKAFYLPHATGELQPLGAMDTVVVLSLLSTMHAVNEIATRLKEGDKL